MAHSKHKNVDDNLVKNEGGGVRRTRNQRSVLWSSWISWILNVHDQYSGIYRYLLWFVIFSVHFSRIEKSQWKRTIVNRKTHLNNVCQNIELPVHSLYSYTLNIIKFFASTLTALLKCCGSLNQVFNGYFFLFLFWLGTHFTKHP